MANSIQQTEEYFLSGVLDIIDLGPIGEILYNEYVKLKICQRLSLGWNETYFDPHFSESRERMVHPFTSPHQINQGLMLMYDSITPHQQETSSASSTSSARNTEAFGSIFSAERKCDRLFKRLFGLEG